jgi:hypothetical protein
MKTAGNQGGLFVFVLIKVFSTFAASLKITNRYQVILEPTFLSFVFHTPKSIDYQKTCSVIPAAPQDTGLSGWLLRQRGWHPGLGFGKHLSELLPLHNLLPGKEVGQFI